MKKLFILPKAMIFAIALFAQLFLTIILHAQLFTFQQTEDLNSDGRMETIRLELLEDAPNRFILHIDDKNFSGTLGEEEIDGFRIVDINKNDRYKEIAVHNPGPSDDDEYLILWYDGNSIIKMAHLARWPVFLGNGIVYVDNWEGFWKKRDKYVLNDTDRTLSLVPQFAWYVGVKVKVENSFPIYRNRDMKDVVAYLGKDSEIELLLCDTENKNWPEYLYLIKSGSGLTGWASFNIIGKNCTGFSYAD